MSTRARLVGAVLWAAAGIVAGAPALAQGEPVNVVSGDGAMLRGLDKISGTTTELPLGIGETIVYGRMAITLVAFRYPTDNPEAEAYAFLDIIDETRGEQLFRGWMIASSPALNALDHARYDVWVIGCQ